MHLPHGELPLRHMLFLLRHYDNGHASDNTIQPAAFMGDAPVSALAIERKLKNKDGSDGRISIDDMPSVDKPGV